jgi:hypothetical protein
MLKKSASLSIAGQARHVRKARSKVQRLGFEVPKTLNFEPLPLAFRDNPSGHGYTSAV